MFEGDYSGQGNYYPYEHFLELSLSRMLGKFLPKPVKNSQKLSSLGRFCTIFLYIV